MKETKTKYAIYLYPSLVEEMETMMKDANADSKSEFVSNALRFYIGYLKQGKNVDYLAPIVAQTIKEEIAVPRRISPRSCSSWPWNRQCWRSCRPRRFV